MLFFRLSVTATSELGISKPTPPKSHAARQEGSLLLLPHHWDSSNILMVPQWTSPVCYGSENYFLVCSIVYSKEKLLRGAVSTKEMSSCSNSATISSPIYYLI
jgi:hypothetical protein